MTSPSLVTLEWYMKLAETWFFTTIFDCRFYLLLMYIHSDCVALYSSPISFASIPTFFCMIPIPRQSCCHTSNSSFFPLGPAIKTRCFFLRQGFFKIPFRVLPDAVSCVRLESVPGTSCGQNADGFCKTGAIH